MPALYPSSVNPDAIKRFTTLLADAASDADPTTPVATCGAWTLDDLVWHVTEVQDFWSFIIGNRPAGPADYTPPARVAGAGLVAALRDATARLTDALTDVPANEAAWSWASEQTVGFSVRRQTHEALTHTVDGLLALGLDLPSVSPELAADGVDEIVHVMLEPPADAPAAAGTVVLQAVDTADEWTVNIGEGHCTISGTALELNLWLWGRASDSPLALTGATDQAAALRSRIAGDTQ